MPYCNVEDQRKWYKANAENVRWRHIENKYGVSYEQFQTILEQQGYACALCLTPFEGLKRREMHIDHCHSTQTVRGILCMKCNVGLGMLGDNEEGLLRALSYVTKENAVGQI